MRACCLLQNHRLLIVSADLVQILYRLPNALFYCVAFIESYTLCSDVILERQQHSDTKTHSVIHWCHKKPANGAIAN